MSDPQDLLYTNKFVEKSSLTNSELVKELEYYNRFKNYIDDGVVDETEKYIKDNLNETSEINIDRTLYKKWPIDKNKNHYPLFDTYINDISVDRYKKEIVTRINIDSKNRDISLYLNSNNFSLPLGKVFNNIKKIVVSDINFRNMNQSVNNTNNNIAWQYPSQNFLINNNIDNKIIPNPGIKNISFSDIPNSAYAYDNQGTYDINIDNYLVYQTNINPGFYSTDTLISSIKKSTSKILHGQNNSIEVKVIEQPYLAFPKMIGLPHLFSCDINPLTNVVNFVNRIEEVQIAAIQTFSPYENDFVSNDIFNNFLSDSSYGTKYGLDPSYIYVLLPANDVTYQYYQNTNCIYRPNPFPLVITNLTTSVGNIDPELLNYVEFYDYFIYLNVGYDESEIKNISYYKVIDTIIINNNITNTTTKQLNYSKTYIRLGLKLAVNNNSNIGSLVNSSYIKPAITENIIISDTLKKFLDNYNNVYVLSGSTSIGSIKGTESGSMTGTIIGTESGSMTGTIIGTESGSMTGTITGTESGSMTGTITGNILTNINSITYNTGCTGYIGCTGYTGYTGYQQITYGISTSTIDCTSTNTTTNNIEYTTANITANNIEYTTANKTTNIYSSTSYSTSGLLCEYKYVTDKPLIGRALLFKWIFDKQNRNYVDFEYETDNVKKRSLLNILAWPIANETLGLYTIDDNYGFRFVHSNERLLLLTKSNISNYQTFNTIYPILSLNLQYISGKYYFVNNSYIFLKLNFNSTTSNSHSDQYYNALSDSEREYNQVYVGEQFFNVGIGEDYTSISSCKYINVYKKDQTDIFTKIMLSNIPGNYDFITSNTVKDSYYINYDFVDDNISEISIGVYDSNMTLLTVLIDFSFTLELHEIHYVLKETLVDSKTNSVSTTGNFM